MIQFSAYAGGYPSVGDAAWDPDHLIRAANEWNCNGIGILFRYTPVLQDVCFVLGYGGEGRGTLAQAFFPNGNDVSNVIVYRNCFFGGWKENMWCVSSMNSAMCWAFGTNLLWRGKGGPHNAAQKIRIPFRDESPQRATEVDVK